MRSQTPWTVEPHSRHIAGDQVIGCFPLILKSLLSSFPQSPYFPPLVSLILSWNDFSVSNHP